MNTVLLWLPIARNGTGITVWCGSCKSRVLEIKFSCALFKLKKWWHVLAQTGCLGPQTPLLWRISHIIPTSCDDKRTRINTDAPPPWQVRHLRSLSFPGVISSTVFQSCRASWLSHGRTISNPSGYCPNVSYRAVCSPRRYLSADCFPMIELRLLYEHCVILSVRLGWCAQ